MHPAGSHGKMVFSTCPVCARPRLSALTTLAPRAQSRGWPSSKGIVDQRGDYPEEVSPMSVYNILQGLFLVDIFFFSLYGKLINSYEGGFFDQEIL
jgi:hypothetical protein